MEEWTFLLVTVAHANNFTHFAISSSIVTSGGPSVLPVIVCKNELTEFSTGQLVVACGKNQDCYTVEGEICSPVKTLFNLQS